ncbi:hypothetical protein PVAP13_1KG081300 [Panicum virgatum]|uniref:Uncharacterized protein n=1 Tax=Panicum virgatum TaxID=38727 RepID=A0A8T0XCC4_PANVG|nr:hypothetical protein PVAP13_1KG081300 [Panicum virgatum]
MTATWASLQTRSAHMTLSGRLHSAPCAVRTANALDLHNFSFAGLFGGLKISASGLEDHTIQIAAKRGMGHLHTPKITTASCRVEHTRKSLDARAA